MSRQSSRSSAATLVAATPRSEPGSGVRLRSVELGKPVQNTFVESLNGKRRDECLYLHWFRDSA